MCEATGSAFMHTDVVISGMLGYAVVVFSASLYDTSIMTRAAKDSITELLELDMGIGNWNLLSSQYSC